MRHLSYTFIIALLTALLSNFSCLTAAEPSADSQQLADQLWDLRGEHQPLTDERFAPVRAELRQKVERLSRVIDRSRTADRWRKYLKWDLLLPHLEDDVTLNRETLENLDAVLRRFNGNVNGLELRSFRETADALQRYRELAFWYALAKRRDTTPLYESLVKQLQEQLRRHLEAPTVETARRIAKSVATIDYQGYAPELVNRLRSRFKNPNVQAELSVAVLNRLTQPVTECEDVNDCILGARVRGDALVNGQVRFAAVQSDQRVRLDINLTGQINTKTVSYKKPVKIYSTGTTDYHGSKSVLVNDEYFQTTAAHVSANTRNRPYRVRKTGGKFGRRLVEKIAWKKVCEKKRQSERIASSKASSRVTKKFDERVVGPVAEGRDKYEEKLRLPLMRRGFEPSEIQFATTSSAITTNYALATATQLTTASHPPGKSLRNDVTVQVHESAVNNFIPFALAGVALVKDSPDTPQRMEGDLPKWLKQLNEKNEQREEKEVSAEAEEDFKPYRLVFNREQPVSVGFDDEIMTVRLRFASMQTGDEEDAKPMLNWDFLVRYRVKQRDNQVVLVRDGDIEAFPTGFDPRWDTKLTPEQVGYRKNLAANLNKRAEEGQGFPNEIDIPEIKLGREGTVQRELAIEQLECDNGWLTIGYRLP